MSVAFVLSPYPSPSDMPAATAITFFDAAHNSTPITSGFVYTRKDGAMNISWNSRPTLSS